MKDLSREGMAMNIREPAGQMWRRLGWMTKDESEVGSMRNSHHKVSMYSWWKLTRAYFIMWKRAAEWAPSAPISRSKFTSISPARCWLCDDSSLWAGFWG